VVKLRPHLKKSKKSTKKKKHRAHGTKVFVSLYHKPADEEKENAHPELLGVYTQLVAAYDRLIDQLLEDLKKKRTKKRMMIWIKNWAMSQVVKIC